MVMMLYVAGIVVVSSQREIIYFWKSIPSMTNAYGSRARPVPLDVISEILDHVEPSTPITTPEMSHRQSLSGAPSPQQAPSSPSTSSLTAMTPISSFGNTPPLSCITSASKSTGSIDGECDCVEIPESTPTRLSPSQMLEVAKLLEGLDQVQRLLVMNTLADNPLVSVAMYDTVKARKKEIKKRVSQMKKSTKQSPLTIKKVLV